MSDERNRPARRRIVVEASSRRHSDRGRRVGRQPEPRPSESLVAISVIAAAALATFIALFLTSRPYDPMNSTVLPQQSVPQEQAMVQPSPKPSPLLSPQQKSAAAESPEPTEETAKTTGPDDATIQSQIEKAFTADPTLAKLDVSTLVEQGRVTVVGSVRSADLKIRVEKVVNSVKGVVGVDNQLVITEGTP
jgi:hypothetical protein